MAKSRIDTLNAVINENFALLDTEASSALERRLAGLRDRAMLIALDGPILPGETAAEEFHALFAGTKLPDGIPDVTADYLDARNRAELLSDKLTVCKFLADELSKRPNDTLTILLGEEVSIRSPRIAYFQNAYADAAFRIFSDAMDQPSVVYMPDFTAVCEEVYYGRADLCMLPLDSSRDAKLISFYRLIDKYELSPVMSCDVTSPDGSVTTRYALLRRGIGLPETLDDSIFFEFTLVPDEDAALCDVLEAARECDLTLYKVDSIPLTYSDSEFSSDIILKIGTKRGFEAFALFMTLAVPQYEPLGVYRHILAKG